MLSRNLGWMIHILIWIIITSLILFQTGLINYMSINMTDQNKYNNDFMREFKTF
jgi:hypothetical protein